MDFKIHECAQEIINELNRVDDEYAYIFKKKKFYHLVCNLLVDERSDLDIDHEVDQLINYYLEKKDL